MSEMSNLVSDFSVTQTYIFFKIFYSNETFYLCFMFYVLYFVFVDQVIFLPTFLHSKDIPRDYIS